MNFLKYFFGIKGKSRTIFIVEDNVIYARALEEYLKRAFPDVKEVKTFDTGEVVLSELHLDPSIIIMDHYLNQERGAVSGLETIKHIRAKKPGTSIMLLSAQGDISVALEATKKYKCHYVKKDEQAFNKVEEFIRQVW
jgi:DNA-binding NtrC family response regulator